MACRAAPERTEGEEVISRLSETSPFRGAEYLADQSFASIRMDNEELVNESYDLFAKAFLPTPYPNTAGMKTSFEYVAMTRPDVLDHKPEEYVDRSFVEELDKSGFIKKLYEK